jgi:hypothetical protein
VQRGEQMRFVHCQAAEATLPEMAGTLLTRVHASGIGTMNLRKVAAQSVDMLGNEDQMEVIGHQHPAPHCRSLCATMLGQQNAISGIVRIAEERLPPPVTTLRCVMRSARQNEARKAGLDKSFAKTLDQVNSTHCHRNSKFFNLP